MIFCVFFVSFDIYSASGQSFVFAFNKSRRGNRRNVLKIETRRKHETKKNWLCVCKINGVSHYTSKQLCFFYDFFLSGSTTSPLFICRRIVSRNVWKWIFGWVSCIWRCMFVNFDISADTRNEQSNDFASNINRPRMAWNASNTELLSICRWQMSCHQNNFQFFRQRFTANAFN